MKYRRAALRGNISFIAPLGKGRPGNQAGSALFFAMCVGMLLLFEMSLAWEASNSARLSSSLALLGRVERARETSYLGAVAGHALAAGSLGEGRAVEVELPSGAIFRGVAGFGGDGVVTSGRVDGGPFRVWGPVDGSRREVAVRISQRGQ